MKCYEGSEPYIFLSYAHKNTDMVMPVFKGLYGEGFRIWYDTSIEAGSVWMDYIADHVQGSKCFIACITEEYLASNNCMSELSFAISFSGTVNVLVIFMEDVKLPSGMAMYLSRLQGIYRSKFDSEKDFLEALYSSKLLNACRTVLPDDPYSNIRDVQEAKTFNRLPSNEKELSQNGEQRKIKTQRNEAPQETEPPARYSEGLTYEKLADGTYAVTGIGTCMDTELVIPPTTPEGGKVTSIGSFAFGFFPRRNNPASITIPNGVTSICDYAFGDWMSLESIDIPASVISIGKGVFSRCYSLTSISVHPDNPEYYSLDNCIIERKTNQLVAGILTSRIPESVASIGDEAYCGGRSSLESIDIPTGVFSIGDYAFADCCGLESIDIPTSVISIGEGVFSGCNDLTSIFVRPNNRHFYSLDNCVIDRHGNVLVAGINTSQIPQGVKHIGNHAFSNLYDLFSIDLPNGVNSIGAGAFEGCENLEAIDLPNGVTSIGAGAFKGCVNLEAIDLPNGVISIGAGAFEGCTNLEAMDIPTSVISIGDSAFSDCHGLTSVTIMSRIFSIGSFAFEDCRSLSTITIPDSVTSIGKWAFSGCCVLPSIAIPNRVTLIGTGAFYGCSGLTSITIPTGVKSIGEDAFGDCSNATIYCEHPSQPATWDENWNPDNRPVVWGYKPQ